ncbi:type II toxin-antitoxin system VapC family toxin [Nocardia pseudobrasiliensis]|uniref:Ribonuclease VapC n=1 Tax=Nocardia pseudobrasiliensis TaxID=45979 RepID=A0A370I1E6_9NOCA|nr:PIN domain-containing protein [Nocardia pseudobrasiliensis]RDI64001.1 putative nucleic acid-binding protein [Nocardia pseudobrasiliensis]
MIVIADTSGILALLNLADPEHLAVRRAANAASTLVVSALAITEVHHVATVRGGRESADRALLLLADRIATTRVEVANVDVAQIRTAVSIRRQYRDLDLDLVDAVCVTLAAEYDTDAVLTLDRRDFRALRPLSYPAFRLLPDDMN